MKLSETSLIPRDTRFATSKSSFLLKEKLTTAKN